MATDAIKLTPPRPRGHQITAPRRSNNTDTQFNAWGLARFLGWFHIGLGMSQLIAPGVIERLSGTAHRKTAIRLYGLREVAAGVGILTQPRPAKWLWAQVAGDFVNAAAIVKGSQSDQRAATVGALAAMAGVAALDIVCAKQCTATAKDASSEAHAEASLLINRTPEECYRFWREVENIPRFASETLHIQKTGDQTSHWRVSLPRDAGQVEWDAEIVEDVPNERISWRSVPREGVTVNGSVAFEAAPGGRGTIVRVQIEFDHPGVSITGPLSTLIGKHPGQIINKSLRRLKQLMEVGEILTTDGQPAGRRDSTTWLDAIAR